MSDTRSDRRKAWRKWREPALLVVTVAAFVAGGVAWLLGRQETRCGRASSTCSRSVGAEAL